jgi:ureidoacrylate peracid hydrolase
MPLELSGAGRTALLVIDMQNGFCASGGSFATLGLDVSMCAAAVGACQRLVAAAHDAGVPVIFTRYVYRADYQDGGVLVREILPAMREARSLAAGTWDAELVDELVPSEADFVVDKNRYSAFYATGLEPILTSLDVRNLVLCGVTTNMCVETTARDASQRDYRVFVVSDATGELDRTRHDLALNTIGFGFGAVVPSEHVMAAWAGQAGRVA